MIPSVLLLDFGAALPGADRGRKFLAYDKT
jgi:hypothetical protein